MLPASSPEPADIKTVNLPLQQDLEVFLLLFRVCIIVAQDDTVAAFCARCPPPSRYLRKIRVDDIRHKQANRAAFPLLESSAPQH